MEMNIIAVNFRPLRSMTQPSPLATAPVTKVTLLPPHLHLYPAELSNQNEGLLGVRYDWGGKFVLLICMEYSPGGLPARAYNRVDILPKKWHTQAALHSVGYALSISLSMLTYFALRFIVLK